jgi:hypothetical protein
MKDLGEANYILGIKLLRDRKNKMTGLSQATYIDKVIARFSMADSKKGLLHFRHGVALTKEQCPQTPQQVEQMKDVPYASAVGSLMYAMLCTRPQHWVAVKHILKYLRRTRDYVLVYRSEDLTTTGYTDSDFQLDCDS